SILCRPVGLVGKLVGVKELSEDAVGDLRRLVAARTGTRCDGIVLKRWRAIFGDRVTRGDLAEHLGLNMVPTVITVV
uniref:Uncharacterized protein n=1 Tax=Kryptolebias marmoratus TaxID=37003 RepID=A0A3Q3BDL5_KRYMA